MDLKCIVHKILILFSCHYTFILKSFPNNLYLIQREYCFPVSCFLLYILVIFPPHYLHCCGVLPAAVVPDSLGLVVLVWYSISDMSGGPFSLSLVPLLPIHPPHLVHLLCSAVYFLLLPPFSSVQKNYIILTFLFIFVRFKVI